MAQPGDMMRIVRPWTVIALVLAGSGSASAQDYASGEALEARVWLDRGDEPLLQRGERVRVYYRTSADAFVAIFRIDTDGSVHLLSPRSPDDDDFVRGGQDYRLLFPTSPYWFVDEYPGQGYFFVVASPEPLDYSAFDYSRYERGWDLTRVGRTVYQDPYLAIDDYVARIVPNWETVPYALDVVTYDVGEAHDYPRFLCYDCHGYQSYATWNPYTYACSSFRVVVWDDPWFYPAYRYGGTRVVYVQPRRGVPRYEFVRRGPGDGWSPIRRTRQPPRRVEYAEPSIVRPPPAEFVPPRRRIVPSDQLRDARPPATSRPATGGGAPAGGRVVTPPPRDGDRSGPTVIRGRPSTGVTAPGRGSGTAGPTRPRSGERPVLERRPPRSGGVNRPSSGVSRPGGAARPSTGVTRPSGVTRPGAGVRPPSGVSRPGSRPSATRPPAGGNARAVRPPARGKGAAAPVKPPPKRKPGGKPGGAG